MDDLEECEVHRQRAEQRTFDENLVRTLCRLVCFEGGRTNGEEEGKVREKPLNNIVRG